MPQQGKLRVPDELAGLIRHLHPHLKKKVKAALRGIIADPSSGKAVKDELQGLMSFRVGTFRIVYRRGDARVIELVAIGPRKRIYEETFRLLKRQAEEEGRSSPDKH